MQEREPTLKDIMTHLEGQDKKMAEIKESTQEVVDAFNDAKTFIAIAKKIGGFLGMISGFAAALWGVYSFIRKIF